MLSNYFRIKTNSIVFEKTLLDTIEKLNGKKILIYGAGEGFQALNKKYDFCSKLNIIGIADKKFEENDIDNFLGMTPIKPNDIQNIEYDMILVSNEWHKGIIKFLIEELNIAEEKIETVFKEDITDELTNINYLCEYNFENNLANLKKKLKNKKIMIYGAGIFFAAIHKYFDLDGLNIIGIADRRFEEHTENEQFLGYKVYSPNEIRDVNPDYVLVATKFFIDIIEDLDETVLKNSKIKIKPLMKKPFLVLWKEIWGE